MARKIEKKPAAAAESDSAAETIEALKPDASTTIAGRAITVREYGYFEGLEVAHRASGFIADLLAAGKGGQLRFAHARRLFGVHEPVVVAIAAQAADVEPDWVRGLKPVDAEAFMATWFAVNAGFFMQEVVNELQEELQLHLMASRSTGSFSGSPAPVSATSTDSAASPSVS
jgi:hypothetical protein